MKEGRKSQQRTSSVQKEPDSLPSLTYPLGRSQLTSLSFFHSFHEHPWVGVF